MKARWLGLDKLQFWDRNAPLPETPKATIPGMTPRTQSCPPITAFAPEMADIARRFFDRQWIDAPSRPGKTSGAFAHPTVPSVHPYVLVNYLGKPRDVMTLAHELGHGVHQVLAGDQGALMASTPLTLAETASVFGEMLTFRALARAHRTDRRERKAMLAQKVEDMINTVVRQIAFYEFERRVHTARREGELTSEQLGKLWLDVQSESLGPAVRAFRRLRDVLGLYSAFHSLAVLCLCLCIRRLPGQFALLPFTRTTPDGFRERYFDMLKAGGTKHHSELLEPFGLDASDPGFWNQGLVHDRGFD
jgi:oligoendopeptidase F